MLNAFAQFHFLRPEWFMALIPILLIITWLRFEKKSQGDWQQIIPKHLLKHLLHEKQGSSSNAALSLLAILWLIATLALAGPTWQKIPQPVYEKIDARVYVLDLSYSMYAADLKPSRIVRARLKLRDLLNAKREGLSALVVFSGDAYVVTPLTNDVNTILSLVPALEPKIMPNVGSNAKEGVYKALELLTNTKLGQGEIILISDEVLLNDRQNINALLENSPYTLSILGVGTTEGAPIKLPNGQFLKDDSGAIVIPKLNESELNTLAEDNGGRFVKLRQDDKDVRYLHKGKTLNTSNDSRESQQNFDLWLEAGQLLMLPILLLAAFAFRRGWLLALLLCLNFMPVSEKLYADELQPSQNATQTKPQAKQTKNTEQAPSALEKMADTWQGLWLNGDQRGIKSMQSQNFAAATKQFNNQDWKASAHYYNGQFSQAAELFTVDKEASKNVQSDTWYNRGNALARAGNLTAAIKAYDESLALNPDNEDATFNKKLVENLKNNPPKQENNQGQEKNKDKKQKQEQQDGEKQESQNGEQSEQQNEQQDEQENGEQSDSQQKQDSENQSENTSDQEPQQEQQDSENQQSDEQSEKPSDESNEQTEETDKSEAQQSEVNDEENQDKAGSEEALSPLDREKQQSLEQWLRQVPDDPSGLMRRKFENEFKQRKSSKSDKQQAW